MKHLVLLLSLCIVLSGCGGSKSPPRNLDNACSILDQRPKYKRAFRATERKWGVPVAVQMAIMHQESKFDGDAKTPMKYALGIIPMGRQSSAFGYAQALDGTWDEYRRSSGNRWGERDDIRDATDFMGWYMTETRRRNGISLGNARNQYLAYHEGQTGYARGSYKRKKWLLRVANKVAARARRYQSQLRYCS